MYFSSLPCRNPDRLKLLRLSKHTDHSVRRDDMSSSADAKLEVIHFLVTTYN